MLNDKVQHWVFGTNEQYTLSGHGVEALTPSQMSSANRQC